MLPGLRRAVVLGATLLLTLLPTSPAEAVPPGWTEPTGIPGTAGDFNQKSATAPDGADVVVWVDDGSSSGAQIKARLRAPGSTRWQRVPARVDNRASIQDLTLASAPNGDFWLAWVTYVDPGPEVFVQRLDSSLRRWSAPAQVFVQPGYRHSNPTIAVAGTGTVVVGASAQPVVSTSPPTYRAIVGTLAPGDRSWKSRFLSPADDFAGAAVAAAGEAGELAVAFVRGYELFDMRVLTAVRPAGDAADWQVSRLSVRGDSQRVPAPAVGADGTVAVTWGAPATSATTLRIASTRIRARPQPWSVQDAQPAGPPVAEAAVVVDREGTATVVWGQIQGGVTRLQARRFAGGVLGPVFPVSPLGESGRTGSLRLRTDGKVALLGQQYTTAGANLGLRYRLLDGDTAGRVLRLTDGAVENENQAALGLTAAGRAGVVLTQGFPTPATEFVVVEQSLSRPAVLRGAFRSSRVTEAAVVGRPRVGARLSCRSGYWVEATSLRVTWRRDGRRIAEGDRYRVRAADSGHGLSCEVRGVNDVGAQTVASPRRRIA